ncbi:MAG: hypothetical protein A3G35_15125 [candidate division NC10 bacterium RIFCSPLOWO2_12_FULL_66_18]|nr:MAG: hypothetical protein A3H39_10450 [candidate division NC10 bacterium RIFCSPLOWO2_02_FULL_66_22]OGB98692.1 MAG: hypothetical protein A3G35_15125 [candidate division NC10 bacterium RIFCSPLOWO2_12_FULL_66_18]
MIREPISVLYLSVNAGLGGAERTVLNLLRCHDRRKVRPLLCTFRDGRLVCEARMLGIPAWVIPARRFRNLVNLWQTTSAIRAIVRREAVDIVHSAMALGHLYGSLARAGTRAKAVWFQQGLVGKPSSVDRLATLVPADLIFANSEATAALQRSLAPFLGNVRVVHLGVDLREFSLARLGEREEIRRRLDIKPDTVVVGVPGRFEPRKGQHVLIEAAKLLREEFPEVTYLLIGDAIFGLGLEYARQLRSLVRDWGLEHQVRFVGFQDDVAGILAGVDVVVHASTSPEPFGLVIVEGMAMARPVVASDGGGAREIVVEGMTGFLTPMGEARALAQRLRELLRDAELRERMGAAGRSRVEARFSADGMARTIEVHYAEVLDGACRR